ncbi:unnamed protein product [Rotaria sp. Silwood2]|nr:unnamed protein product [Rotaria sp. Silwood2]
MSISCNGSCINVYDTQNVLPKQLQLMITLNIPLNVTQRIIFLNKLLNDISIFNDSYTLTLIQMSLNPLSNELRNFTANSSIPPCEECSILGTGACFGNNSTCACIKPYEGYLCRDTATSSVAPVQTSDRNWTIIIAVVSAVAGLLLIVSIVMCVFFIIKQRQTPVPSAKLPQTRPKFTIPRAHIPTNVTSNPEIFSLDNTNDESYVDTSDSLPSSSNTTYNTTYRPNGTRPEADFGIFDELENRIPLSKGQIPRPQMRDMIGTLNSLPGHERFDGPSGAASTFSDSRDLDDIEFVTDMVDDMTKDDDMEDEFVEALNPNLAMPRSALQPEMKSSGWFSFFRNS